MLRMPRAPCSMLCPAAMIGFAYSLASVCNAIVLVCLTWHYLVVLAQPTPTQVGYGAIYRYLLGVGDIVADVEKKTCQSFISSIISASSTLSSCLDGTKYGLFAGLKMLFMVSYSSFMALVIKG